MKKILVILGPTGTGKTVLADEVCMKLGGEIISADSRQVYKYLDVGTNKTRTETPQHLIDILNPDETFSVGDFFNLASEKIERLTAAQKLPVVCGGTGLYIKTLLNGGLAEVPRGEAGIRAELSKLNTEELYEKLLQCDPVSALKNKKNPHRLIRALEVYRLTGIPLSEWHSKQAAQNKSRKNSDKFVLIGLNMEKSKLMDRIFERSKRMVDGGMIEETVKVLKMGYPRTAPAFGAIGYEHVFEYLENRISKEKLIENIASDTKKYIKRQNTWFKKDKSIFWIDAANMSTATMYAVIKKYYDEQKQN